MYLKLDLFQKDLFYVIIWKKKCEKQTNTIIYKNGAYPNYPYCDFPALVQIFETFLTMGEMNVYGGLYVTKHESYDIEKNTIDQWKIPFWKSTRKYRLTSTCFKRTCSQKREHETWPVVLFLETKVMTGNNVLRQGLLLTPRLVTLVPHQTGRLLIQVLYKCKDY